ncbi:MAG: hypothetical protein ISR44_07990 [Rhodospirillales bacterium]|nr:hypothetical protein [Alphaproteobacteria bacterium]MBL6929101.1 hypothetical protein [Rhodospirillales bacterium]
MAKFDPHELGPVIAGILSGAPPMPLDAGAPNSQMADRLRGLTADGLFPGQTINDPDMAAACLAAMWLRHGFLDDAHTLCQAIHTPTGSYWHGIMHRREGDYSNAKYWFRRVGDHPVFATLGAAARDIAALGDGPAARTMAAQDAWDPFYFIDMCEIAVGAGKPDDLLWRQVQRAEWEILFTFCRSGAIRGDRS